MLLYAELSSGSKYCSNRHGNGFVFNLKEYLYEIASIQFHEHKFFTPTMHFYVKHFAREADCWRLSPFGFHENKGKQTIRTHRQFLILNSSRRTSTSTRLRKSISTATHRLLLKCQERLLLRSILLFHRRFLKWNPELWRVIRSDGEQHFLLLW